MKNIVLLYVFSCEIQWKKGYLCGTSNIFLIVLESIGTRNVAIAAIHAIVYIPNHIIIPIHHAYQMLAAVVRFLTWVFSVSLIMSPAQRNQIPVTICSAILEVEFGSTISDKNVNIMDHKIT